MCTFSLFAFPEILNASHHPPRAFVAQACSHRAGAANNGNNGSVLIEFQPGSYTVWTAIN